MALLENKVFADVIKMLSWGPSGLGWELNPVAGVLTRRPCEGTETGKEACHVKMEADI